MGPRRVGKTVILHHSIARLLEEDVPPRNICYISVDHPMYNGISIDDLLDLYQEASGTDYRQVPCYVLLDEIQYMREWEGYLKSLVDRLDAPKFIVSGSAAAALKLKSTESGAGRFTEFHLPPLTFYEYMKLLKKTDLID
ncbi:MAG: AAA family ATPase, partial [Proteobacteria bacterium]|nr:AAA family ATPase [Pseudomonadota bacterium]